MKKVVFFQSEHTLAKLIHNMGFADSLSKCGYNIVFAVSKRGSKFLAENSSYRFVIVPQCWELQPESHFINTWFQDEQHIRHVFNKELEVLEKEKPDFVVNNVSFTAKLACRKTGVPMVSIIPPLMIQSKMVLRSLFTRKTLLPEVAEKMAVFIDKWEVKWWDKLASPFRKLLMECGEESINDVRWLLSGDYQVIYSLPEYELADVTGDNVEYTGPLVWGGWKDNGVTYPNDIILCTFGTKMVHERNIVYKTVEAIRKFEKEYFVVHTDEAESFKKIYGDIKNVEFIKSYNPEKILPKCKAVFCQGGYSLVLLCYNEGIPVLTVPFQLEQMYHAKKLEEKGVGLCLTTTPKIKELIDADIGGEIFTKRNELITSDMIYNGLDQIINNKKYYMTAHEISRMIKEYSGCECVTNLLKRKMEPIANV